MGCASSVGLGLALAQPERRVIVLDGDGAALMRLGAMATLGYQRPDESRARACSTTASTNPRAVSRPSRIDRFSRRDRGGLRLSARRGRRHARRTRARAEGRTSAQVEFHARADACRACRTTCRARRSTPPEVADRLRPVARRGLTGHVTATHDPAESRPRHADGARARGAGERRLVSSRTRVRRADERHQPAARGRLPEPDGQLRGGHDDRFRHERRRGDAREFRAGYRWHARARERRLRRAHGEDADGAPQAARVAAGRVDGAGGHRRGGQGGWIVIRRSRTSPPYITRRRPGA